MKARSAIVLVCLVLQLALAFSPFLPWLETLFAGSDDISKRLTIERTLIGVYFAVLTAMIAMLLWKRDHEDDAARKQAQTERLDFEQHLLAAVGARNVRTLRDHEFYKDFMSSVKQATRHVCISYFAPFPPDHRKIPGRLAYYDELLGEVQRNPHVHFRRLLRFSELNIPWLRSQCEALRDRHNAHIAVLYDLPGEHKMPLALSIQVVDDKKAWLVAIESHDNEEGAYRDVAIENTDVAVALAGYHKRLWGTAVLVLDGGKLTAQGEKLLGGGQTPGSA